jgi:hypothetical protein
MDVELHCPRCGDLLPVDEKQAGATMECPTCKHQVYIPAALIAKQPASAIASQPQLASTPPKFPMFKCKQCGKAVSIWKRQSLFGPTICKQCLTYAGSVSADALYAAYEANVIAADEKYKNKKVILTGNIERIVKDNIFETPFLVIEVFGRSNAIECGFPKSAISQLTSLSKGESVVVEGKVVGRGLGLKTLHILISDCHYWGRELASATARMRTAPSMPNFVRDAVTIVVGALVAVALMLLIRCTT